MVFVDNGVEQVKGDPLLSKKVWYFIQATNAPINSKAILPASQTEGDTTYGGDSVDEQTKFGRVVLPSTNEDSIELTTYVVPNDKAIEIIRDAKHDGNQVKVWRVVVDKRFAKEEKETEGGATHQVFPAEFGFGTVDELELDDSDDLVEANYTLNILGKLQKGTFPLTDEQINALSEMYEFERPGESTGDFGTDTPKG
ncbi:phage major tail protein, TP901-1 family [Leuconostoc fallax]|uniref:phage major tail protein, TP901-1 family n=1 Tax=Leuconostoc fallax TaxID=1251 RepID=UPI001C1EB903|nr:phage major tail protein, TP901-1 family [Leuconostoc fallax]MBU7455842.1 phage major tail protein, TP901-1 family [Leuconostoc fallax]